MSVPARIDSARAPQAEGASRSVRPFLKWAGGKRQLLPQLRRFVPRTFAAYHESFVGSGALFFDLCHRRQLGGRPAWLLDHNADLIGCYRAVARDVEGVIDHLKRLAARHAVSPAEQYYLVRDELFNPGRLQRRQTADTDEYPSDLAAMFIYLNRTGFNGLFRLNRRGDFNVPAGRYANPRICNEPALRAASSALCAEGVTLSHGAYDSVLASAARGDFIYLDPPYAPLSTTARFTSYTAGGFSDDDQRRLRAVVFELVARGCSVVLSNSTAPIIAELYVRGGEASSAGLRTYRVPARRAINSDASRRGDVLEYIITNVKPTD